MIDKATIKAVAIVGGGPAGLMAAEVLSRAGLAVTLYERMPTLGRKLLMAGRGGLNLTHSEDLERFMPRYRAAAETLRPWIESFTPMDLRTWSESLGQTTFVGSSGRIFPEAMKASPLLRAWTARLQEYGVMFMTRTQWLGWDDYGALLIRRANNDLETVTADAVVLALGGASWPKLGGDGSWVDFLTAKGIGIVPLRPSNCSFVTGWSDIFRNRFAGQPLKNITLRVADELVSGEAMITDEGLEGGAIYALSAPLRDAILEYGKVVLMVDLRPDLPNARLLERLREPLRGQSVSTHLRKAAGLSPLAINLMREVVGNVLPTEPSALVGLIKHLPITLSGIGSMEKAISTAGGVPFSETDEHLMLRRLPGVFVAGEMLDWEAPTGGYLLQASLATGAAAAGGVIRWLDDR